MKCERQREAFNKWNKEVQHAMIKMHPCHAAILILLIHAAGN